MAIIPATMHTAIATVRRTSSPDGIPAATRRMVSGDLLGRPDVIMPVSPKSRFRSEPAGSGHPLVPFQATGSPPALLRRDHR